MQIAPPHHQEAVLYLVEALSIVRPKKEANGFFAAPSNTVRRVTRLKDELRTCE